MKTQIQELISIWEAHLKVLNTPTPEVSSLMQTKLDKLVEALIKDIEEGKVNLEKGNKRFLKKITIKLPLTKSTIKLQIIQYRSIREKCWQVADKLMKKEKDFHNPDEFEKNFNKEWKPLNIIYIISHRIKHLQQQGEKLG